MQAYKPQNYLSNDIFGFAVSPALTKLLLINESCFESVAFLKKSVAFLGDTLYCHVGIRLHIHLYVHVGNAYCILF